MPNKKPPLPSFFVNSYIETGQDIVSFADLCNIETCEHAAQFGMKIIFISDELLEEIKHVMHSLSFSVDLTMPFSCT